MVRVQIGSPMETKMGIGEKLFMFDNVEEGDLFRSSQPGIPHERGARGS